MTMTTPPRILEGMRVLELCHVLAGPHCGRHLADLGAEVIQVESPGGGDYTRHLAAAPGSQNSTLSVEEAHAHPHSVDRRTSETVHDPEHGPRRVFRSAMRFSATPPRPQGPAPSRVGAHTREVLGRVLGYADARIDALVAAGAVHQG